MTKEAAIVICPGRGTYNKLELGYLQKYHTDKPEFISGIDDYRKKKGQAPISELDCADSYKVSLHTRGDNASALIYACAVADYMSINKDRYDIVGITGNSMGWYLALACGNALQGCDGVHVVNSMGMTMQDEAPGGQIIYPIVDENWQIDTNLLENLEGAISKGKRDNGNQIYTSIRLGGMAILAANDKGVKRLLELLPPVQEKYPYQLQNHGAFHSPLMKIISDGAKKALGPDLLKKPHLPLIDGRGHIWKPHSTNLDELHDYTFGQQIHETYDYTKAIEVALKEFGPSKLIVLGPGNTLGAPTAQCVIQNNWYGIDGKKSFIDAQKEDPFILSMGINEQRKLVVR